MEDSEKTQALKDKLSEFEEYFFRNLNRNDYLSGSSEPIMIDCHVFPMVERLVMLENSPLAQIFESLELKATYPSMYAYIHRFRQNEK